MSSPEPKLVELPFWLVSTCEVQNINYALEVTSVKIFTKWQFQSCKFFEGSDLITLLHFDDDYDDKSKEDAIRSLLSGKAVNGIRVSSTAPSDCFPVNPDQSVQNEVGGTQIHIGPSRLQLDLKEQTVFCQLVFNVNLHTPFNMKTFPFDRHIIPIVLSTRVWKEGKKPNVHKFKWSILEERPNWAEGKYEEDEIVISENVAWVDGNAEMQHLPPILHIDVNLKKPVLCLRIERNPTYFILNITVPIYTIGLMSTASFFLEFNNANERLNAVLTSALAIAAYKVAIQTQLPVKSYITIGDGYILFCFLFQAALVLKTILAFQGQGHGVGFFWYSADDGGDDWNSTQRLYQAVDDATSWVFVFVWLIVHAIGFIDVAKPNGNDFVRRFFQPTWESVIDGIRKPFDLVQGMNKAKVSTGQGEDEGHRRGSLIPAATSFHA